MDETVYNRMSGRVGNTIRLNATFYKNGVPTDPYAIRSVKIYKRSVEDANLVAEIPFPSPDSTEYPAPASENNNGPCTGSGGSYELLFDIPCDFPAPDLYFDVWCFIPDLNCLETTAPDLDDESLWQCACNKFWVYPDGWYVDDHLMVPRLGFEPLDVQFRAGEKRFLEVGIMPLPLYDYDYNMIMPLIPYLQAKITIGTGKGCDEIIVNGEDMEMGLRQGSFRTNPFVAKYFLDTSNFFRGTYEYRVTIEMPDCSTFVSPTYTFTVS
jgi:hypothetical protein